MAVRGGEAQVVPEARNSPSSTVACSGVGATIGKSQVFLFELSGGSAPGAARSPVPSSNGVRR